MVHLGATYYEVKMHTKGISQIGWATKDVSFSPEEGSGVGDDGQSFAFDGSRRRLWHQVIILSVDNLADRYNFREIQLHTMLKS